MQLRDQTGTGIVLITHDLGVVASACSRIYIMYGGMIVEQGTADEIFYHAQHPYTQGLLACVQNPEQDEDCLLYTSGNRCGNQGSAVY